MNQFDVFVHYYNLVHIQFYWCDKSEVFGARA